MTDPDRAPPTDLDLDRIQIPTTDALASAILDYVADRYDWPALSGMLRTENVHHGIAACVLNELRPVLAALRAARAENARLTRALDDIGVTANTFSHGDADIGGRDWRMWFGTLREVAWGVTRGASGQDQPT